MPKDLESDCSYGKVCDETQNGNCLKSSSDPT